MIYLETLDNVKLSRGVRNLSPIQQDGFKVKNRLFDGSEHVQTFGTPLKFIMFDILANFEQCDLINELEAIGGEVRLNVKENAYVGLIDTQPEWKRATKAYNDPNQIHFTTTLKLIVKG